MRHNVSTRNHIGAAAILRKHTAVAWGDKVACRECPDVAPMTPAQHLRHVADVLEVRAEAAMEAAVNRAAMERS